VASGGVDPEIEINPIEGLAVKPDGTPFFLVFSPHWMNQNWNVAAEGIARSLIERCGATYMTYDPMFVTENHIAFIEDLITVHHPDGIIIQPTQEDALKPITDRAQEAGIHVVSFDFIIKDTAQVEHDFDATYVDGSNLVGEYYRKIADERGVQIKIFNMFGSRSVQSSLDRSTGLYIGVGDHPNIEIVDSPDTDWLNETTANFILDNFTADPSFNGIFHHGGGDEGAASAIQQLDRYVPQDDPAHIWFVTNNADPAICRMLEEGIADGMGSHGPWDLVDCSVQLLLTSVVLGKPIPDYTPIPMVLVTHDNMDSIQQFGVTPAYCLMPWEKWDLWPVMDLTSLGIETPTVAMRKELLGY
jgi:ABC-type sugar transport system substrate-binding protein